MDPTNLLITHPLDENAPNKSNNDSIELCCVQFIYLSYAF